MCKGIGVSLAWRIQTVISAATSAMAGGLIMSRAVLLIVAKQKITMTLVPMKQRLTSLQVRDSQSDRSGSIRSQLIADYGWF